ncbi:MAG: hypothetical protein JSR77_18590 [Planctomycetes bacterium]|nr:hypothetical protein [Planctomycetota bacterium]
MRITTLLVALALSFPAAAQNATKPKADPPATKKPDAQKPETKSPETRQPESRGPKIDLRPKFKKGQTTHFKLVMNTTGTQDAPGMGEQTQTVNQEVGVALNVKDVNKETGATLELVYESFKLKLKPPGDGEEINFDSTAKNSGDDPIGSMLKGIVGLTLNIKADKDGNITSVETGGKGDALSGAAAGLMGQFTGPDVVKNLFGPIFTARRGSGEAAVGESWTNDDTIDAPWGKIKLVTTNTLKSHRGASAEIDIRGAFSLEPQSAGSPAPSIKDSSLTGTAHWNTETGMLSDMNVRQKLNLESKDTGKTTQEMTLKVTAGK